MAYAQNHRRHALDFGGGGWSKLSRGRREVVNAVGQWTLLFPTIGLEINLTITNWRSVSTLGSISLVASGFDFGVISLRRLLSYLAV